MSRLNNYQQEHENACALRQTLVLDTVNLRDVIGCARSKRIKWNRIQKLCTFTHMLLQQGHVNSVMAKQVVIHGY